MRSPGYTGVKICEISGSGMIYLTQQALEKDFGLNLGSTMPFSEVLSELMCIIFC